MIAFLYPAFLFGVLAAAVPVVLHLLRREAVPRLPFSAVRFLKRAPVEETRRKRLRELLLLALRVSALVLLALAFARPYLQGNAAAASAGITVVALDTSFSMSAPGLFARAQARAAEAVTRVPAGDLIALVAFHDGADTLVESTTDRGLVRAAIDGLAPGYGATRYRALFARVGAIVGTRAGRLVTITDLQRSGWEGEGQATLPSRVTVEVIDVGAASRNLAVTALSRDEQGATAVVLNGGDIREQGRVRLTVDGRTVDERTVDVGATDSTEVRFERVLPATGVATASIDDTVGYAADNTRHLVLDPPDPTEVLVVTSRGADDAFYLEKALTAGGERSGFRLREAEAASTSLSGPPNPPIKEATPPAVTAVLGTHGLDRVAREQIGKYLRAGGGVLVTAGDGLDPAVLSEQLGGAVFEPTDRAESTGPLTLAPVDVRHPVFRSFGAIAGNLAQVRFQRIARIPMRPDDRVLGRFSSGAPALVERRAGGGRLLIFASDVSGRWNDFPRHPTFVPFVHEMMRYLAHERKPPRDFVVADAPRGVPRIPGVILVDRTRRIAINVDPRESETARVTTAEFDGTVGRLGQAAAADARNDDRQREDEQRLWQYGLALMMTALFAEGIIGSRMA